MKYWIASLLASIHEKSYRVAHVCQHFIKLRNGSYKCRKFGWHFRKNWQNFVQALYTVRVTKKRTAWRPIALYSNLRFFM